MYRELKREKDIVFSRFIVYMEKTLRTQTINYRKHKSFLNSKEYLLAQEDWEVFSENDTFHSSFSFDFDDFGEDFEDTNVIRALKKLTILQRKVLYFNSIEEMSIPDIAKKLNISRIAVNRILSRARASFKKYLEVFKNEEKN